LEKTEYQTQAVQVEPLPTQWVLLPLPAVLVEVQATPMVVAEQPATQDQAVPEPPLVLLVPAEPVLRYQVVLVAPVVQ
jgi:hypothetical protein